MMRFTGLFVFLFFVAAAHPIASAAEEAPCGDLPCRANGLPYLSEDGGVIIQPGEAFSVELTIADDKITGVAPRKVPSDLKNSVELKFAASGAGMTLTVKNHSGRMLKYDAYMKPPNGRLTYTSSCPAMAGPFGIESWPHAIEYLELRNFRFLGGEDGVIACR